MGKRRLRRPNAHVGPAFGLGRGRRVGAGDRSLRARTKILLAALAADDKAAVDDVERDVFRAEAGHFEDGRDERAVSVIP